MSYVLTKGQLCSLLDWLISVALLHNYIINTCKKGAAGFKKTRLDAEGQLDKGESLKEMSS